MVVTNKKGDDEIRENSNIMISQATNTIVIVDLPDSLVARTQLDLEAKNPLEVGQEDMEEDEGSSSTKIKFNDIPSSKMALKTHVLRKSLLKFGRLAHFGVIPELSRAVAVFENEQQAFDAYESIIKNPEIALDSNEAKDVQVYFAMHVPVIIPEQSVFNPNVLSEPVLQIDTLKVPFKDKNFLISPPGSPPIGWIQIAEHSPALGGHADAIKLHSAFAALLKDKDNMEFELDEGPIIDLPEISDTIVGDPSQFKIGHQGDITDAVHKDNTTTCFETESGIQKISRQILDFNSLVDKEKDNDKMEFDNQTQLSTLPLVFIDTPLANENNNLSSKIIPKTSMPPPSFS